MEAAFFGLVDMDVLTLVTMIVASVLGSYLMAGIVSKFDLPQELASEVLKCKTDDDAKALGVEWTTQQCKELYESGVKNIHFYTVSAVDMVRQVVENLF